jgi:hypothetical protein
MFTKLPSRIQATIAASVLLVPIFVLFLLGPTLWGLVDQLTAEAVYTTGLSSLLVLAGAAGILSLPRTDAEINAVAGALRELEEALKRFF